RVLMWIGRRTQRRLLAHGRRRHGIIASQVWRLWLRLRDRLAIHDEHGGAAGTQPEITLARREIALEGCTQNERSGPGERQCIVRELGWHPREPEGGLRIMLDRLL